MSYSPFSFYQQSTSSSIALVTNYLNNTGVAIAQGSPCSTKTDGSIMLTDVTSQASIQAFVGYAYTRISDGSYGPIISGGRLLNLTGYSFNVGDAIYLSIGGSLQNVKPVDVNGNPVSPFVEGDFMVFAGVIVQNEVNNTQQDLQILTQDFGVI